MKGKKPFDVAIFHESVKMDFETGLITLEQAAIEFHKGNWTPFIDIEYAKKKLGVKAMKNEVLPLYEKEYEVYFNSLKEGDEVLSLKEFIECLYSKKDAEN